MCEAAAAPDADDQVFPRFHPLPFIAPEACNSVSCSGIGSFHPVAPLIVVPVQNAFAFDQDSIHVAGMNVTPAFVATDAVVAGAVHTPFCTVAGAVQVGGVTHVPFWLTAGAVHTRALTVNSALVLVGL